MKTDTTTDAYINVYRNKDGSIELGMTADSPIQAANFVAVCDGLPITSVKLTFDPSKPLGQRITAGEVRQ
jgi:hypothetical protein